MDWLNSKRKGQLAFAGGFVTLAVFIIVFFAVFLPVLNDMIQTAGTNVSGGNLSQLSTSGNTIANLFPLLSIVGALVFVVSFYVLGRR